MMFLLNNIETVCPLYKVARRDGGEWGGGEVKLKIQPVNITTNIQQPAVGFKLFWDRDV